MDSFWNRPSELTAEDRLSRGERDAVYEDPSGVISGRDVRYEGHRLGIQDLRYEAA